MILITGCGRSGTTYTTVVLRALGLKILHEKMGKDGTVNWRLPYDLPYGPMMPLNRYPTNGLDGFGHIFHQVRNPLKAIPSIHTVTARSWKYISQTEPKIQMSDPLLIRCMKYWMYWNKQCQKISEMTYQIENFNFLDITNVLGVNPTDKQILKALAINKTVNTRAYKITVDYNDFVNADKELAEELKELAEEYGYDITI